MTGSMHAGIASVHFWHCHDMDVPDMGYFNTERTEAIGAYQEISKHRESLPSVCVLPMQS